MVSSLPVPISDAVTIEEEQLPDDGLTLKQRRFIEHYLGDARGNATQAARLAGYQGSDVTIRQMGSENLTKPHILSHIRARAAAVMSAHEVIEHLAAMIRKDEWEYAQEYRNKRGAVVTVRMDNSARVKAIELMMRYHGLLVERVEHSGTTQRLEIKAIVPINPHAPPTITSTATETERQTDESNPTREDE